MWFLLFGEALKKRRFSFRCYTANMNLNCALVMQGGGTRGIYTAGALDYLMEQGITFDAVYGTSAGALCGTDYLSGDIGRTKILMTKYMMDLKFVSFTRLLFTGNLFNFDYLFGELPKKLPFNFEQFDKSPMRFFLGVTCLDDGKAYFLEKDKVPNIWDAIAASSSLPGIAKTPIMIDGKPYLDGGPSCSIGFRFALKDGYKTFVITTRPKGFRKELVKSASTKRKDVGYKRTYKKYPDFVNACVNWDKTYNEEMDEMDALHDAGKILVMYPSKPLNVAVAERNLKKLEEVYQLGKKDMEKMLPELLSYLK